jgi:DNA primase
LQDFDSIKQEIRDRVDLVALVSEHVALKRAGADFRGLCPFHKEKTPSFDVIPSKQIFYCFGCKAGGDCIRFVQLREGITYFEALQLLADRAGVKLGDHRSAGTSSSQGRAAVLKANEWAAGLYRKSLDDQHLGLHTRTYVETRGISPETADRFGLGFALPDSNLLLHSARTAGIEIALLDRAGLVGSNERGGWYETFRNRLMFPIRDASKRVVGFGGRTLGDDKAKYLNTRQSEIFNKGSLLYGLDLARPQIVADRRAIIVEGYTDCIACHQFGFANTVATLGTALTESHVALLRRYCDELVLVFDSDSAGELAAQRGLEVAVRNGLSVRLAFVSEGKDPSDFLHSAGPEAFASVLNQGVDALRFCWGKTLAQFEAQNGPAGRKRAVVEFIGLISSLAGAGAMDPIQRGLLVNQIARLLEVRPEDIQRQIADGQRRPENRPPAGIQPGTGENSPARREVAFASAEIACLTQLLEVLLNEPGYYNMVGNRFDPSRLADPADRAIGRAVVNMAERVGEFTLVELLDSLADDGHVARATELFLRGNTRGNLEATCSGAIELLERLSVARNARQLGTEIGLADTPDNGDDNARRLKEIQEASQGFRHFAPASKLRAIGGLGS